MNLSESIKTIQSSLPQELANVPQLKDIDCGISLYSSGRSSLLFFPSETEKQQVREWLKSLTPAPTIRRSLSANGNHFYWDVTLNGGQWELSFAGMESTNNMITAVEL